MMRNLLIFLVSATVSAVVFAAGGRETTTEFFSDAARTRLVGEIIVGCGGHGQWGRRTAFFTHSSSPCGGLRTKASTSIAATSLLHSDPVVACKLRCSHLPLIICPPPSANQPDCVQPRAACAAACNQLLDPM